MSEAEELLSTPAEWDLPAERHRHFKDVLMHRIDQDQTPAGRTGSPTPGRASGRASVRRRLARPAVLVPLASVALAGALLVTLSVDGRGGSTAASPSAGVTGASGTLNRIATAAMASDATPVRDDQFVYVRTLDRENTGTFTGPIRLGALHTEERWTAQDPGPLRITGWLKATGKDAIMPGQVIPVESPDPRPVGVDRPTYRWLASLPTDPDALLARLGKEARPVEGESRDQAVFSLIGDLISGTIMPPANAAAFYEAAAKLPGVREIPDAVDAAGRHGIAITLDDTGFATRDEWIFDKKTLVLLGARFYVTDPDRGITTETLAGTSAVMERAVVDKKAEVPARAVSR
ncbi:CU044_5270 family protein [Streptomyces sp. NBC_00285]|uniref:CU044_5270 family protein n=1 Tax=Streptomyces sp. NBC_00285 TaxID=2975700 RepID=UPI002E2CE949|nr:CU044_5270 family protein [Streptomyces sp. NBC_00285]